MKFKTSFLWKGYEKDYELEIEIKFFCYWMTRCFAYDSVVYSIEVLETVVLKLNVDYWMTES